MEALKVAEKRQCEVTGGLVNDSHFRMVMCWLNLLGSLFLEAAFFFPHCEANIGIFQVVLVYIAFADPSYTETNTINF